MPKGFGFVNKASQEQAAKGGSSLWGGKTIFKLENGEKTDARFVEIEGDFVHSAWHHEIPVEGRAWGDLVPCIAQDEEGNHTDDPCPGCDAGLQLKFKGYIALIWRDGPIYKRDDANRVVKDNNGDLVVDHKGDTLAVWSSGPRLFEELGETHENYGGLGARDFSIKRRGIKKDTKYIIFPSDPDGGKEPLSKEDKKIIEDATSGENPFELSPFIRPPSYEAWEARLNGTPISSSNGSEAGEASPESQEAADKNPFKRKK